MVGVVVVLRILFLYSICAITCYHRVECKCRQQRLFVQHVMVPDSMVKMSVQCVVGMDVWIPVAPSMKKSP